MQMPLTKRALTTVLLFIIFSVSATATGSAQDQKASTGSIQGVVLDRDGKPITGATVYALPEEDMRRPVASATTDTAGKFTLNDLPAGVVYVYAYKETDGYADGFSNFFAIPNDQSLVSVKVERGHIATLTIKRTAKAAYLNFKVTDEKGQRVPASLTLTRYDQPEEPYGTATNLDGEKSMLVPAVPFRVTVDADGYETWHYGGANYADKGGLIVLKPGQTFNLAVRLRKK
jgi:hypothetical protein